MIPPIRVLLQTTIPESNDDWSIDRFSLLRGYLASLIDGNDNALASWVSADACPNASPIS